MDASSRMVRAALAALQEQARALAEEDHLAERTRNDPHVSHALQLHLVLRAYRERRAELFADRCLLPDPPLSDLQQQLLNELAKPTNAAGQTADMLSRLVCRRLVTVKAALRALETLKHVRVSSGARGVLLYQHVAVPAIESAGRCC